MAQATSAAQAMATRRAVRIQPTAATDIAKQRALTMSDLANTLDAAYYEYFDNFVVSSSQCGNGGAGATGIANWAGLPPNGILTFFSGRLSGGNTNAMTNAEDTNKFAYDFLCNCVMVEPFVDIDAPGAGGVSLQQAWCEIITFWSAFILTFGNSQTKLYIPCRSCPAGGGIEYGVKTRTQGIPSFTDQGSATNGQPTTTARRMLAQPIYFAANQQFSMAIQIQATAPGNVHALARALALNPLTGNFQAGVKLSLGGVRGQPLMIGTPMA
jgi:hypothetical protein